jgi:hypothetical protein
MASHGNAATSASKLMRHITPIAINRINRQQNKAVMRAIFVIIGALIGALLLDWPGTVFGAALGWLIGAYVGLHHELRELRHVVTNLSSTRITTPAATSNSINTSVGTTSPVGDQPTIDV